jgi:hypothetical protein
VVGVLSTMLGHLGLLMGHSCRAMVLLRTLSCQYKVVENYNQETRGVEQSLYFRQLLWCLCTVPQFPKLSSASSCYF